MLKKIKKNDLVISFSRRNGSRMGIIRSYFSRNNKALVSNVNTVRLTKWIKDEGNMIKDYKDMPIQNSKIFMVDPKKGGSTRVGFCIYKGKKKRYAKKSGAIIDV